MLNKDSDFNVSNSVYTVLMMHNIYRQADEPRILIQCPKLHVNYFSL